MSQRIWRLFFSANILILHLGQGSGTYPSVDAWGENFKDRHRSAPSGQRIAGDYVAVLEGVQGDQDFIRILFNPSRFLKP